MSYKKRNQFLLGGGVLFLFFIYYFVISRTLDLYQANSILKEKVLKGENAPQRKKVLEDKLSRFNEFLSPYIIDSLKNRDLILTQVSNFCHKHKIILQEFPAPVVNQEKDFEIETNVIVAEGNFLELLGLVYEIEQMNKIARPASVNFEKKFDYRKKKEVLTVTIYLQNIRLKSHESNS